ncbi:phosphotransferase [Chitinophaga sp. CB10]|uniref:phosphotransferase n=1 Tax=Chitinophaga sp. CB10 TaxID=1891659 RepID=UPI0025C349AF|nr:phosphotransferase [Chitinophaga sp. CB10]
MSFNYAAVFPAERLAIVSAAFDKAFGKGLVSEATLLTGGLSSAAVYKVIADNRAYVMKLDAPGNHSTTASYERLRLAAGAGIAPALRYCSPEEGITISEFIASKPIRSTFTGDVLAEKLATAIKQTHAIPYTTPGEDMKHAVDNIVAGFRSSQIVTGPVPEECLAGYEKIKAVYPWHDTDKVFSHNDLNPTNILCDGAGIWIIDWDTAFLNDRYVDLASVANFFIHSPEQEAVFLKTYFGEVSAYQAARFFIMRQVSRMIYSLMMLQLAAKNKPADVEVDAEVAGVYLKDVGPMLGSGRLSLAGYEGQLMYGKALMNEVVGEMRRERFEEALGRMG